MSSRKYALKGEAREQAGKGVARALRRENKIPGVIYGDGKEAVSISLPFKEVNLEYNKGHMFTSLCSLNVDGKDHLVLARDVQLHPLSDNVLHIDFLRVTPKTKLRVQIPIKFINAEDCEGLTQGGVLNIAQHEIEMFCIATEIPDHIDIDLSSYKLHDAIHISQIQLPAGAKPVQTKDITLATIAEPRRIVEETPVVAAEGEAAAEGAAAPADGEKAEGDKE